MDTSAIAERFSASMASVAAPETTSTTPDIPAPAAAPAATPEPTPAPVTPEPQQAAAPTTPEINFEDDPEPINWDADDAPSEPIDTAPATPETDGNPFAGMLPKEVETAFLKHERGRRMLATFKDMRTLTAEPNYDPATGENLGGLGFVPHAQQVKDWHSARLDMDAMEHEFQANPTSFLLNWLAPTGQYQEGAENVIAAIPQVLQQQYAKALSSNDVATAQRTEKAYLSLFKPLADEWISGIYEQAKNEPDAARKEWLVNTARGAEALLNGGKHRPDDQLRPPSETDKLAAERRQLEEERQQIQIWRQRNETAAAKQAREATIATLDRGIDSDISKVFNTVKDHVKPQVLSAVTAQFKRDMQASLFRNQEVQRRFNFAMSKIRGGGDAEASRTAIESYRSAARQWIEANYKARLKDLVDNTVSQNAAAHATAANGASQVAPATGNGHAAAQSVASVIPPATRQPGEERTEYMARRFRQQLRTQ